MRTGKEAIAFAATESSHPSQDWSGLCLKFTRSCFDVAAKYPDATTAYAHTTRRHGLSNVPAAVPVWWSGGSSGHGHVALADGQGNCWSTDIRRPGKVDLVPITDIHRLWGLTFLGWTEDIEDVDVYSNPVAAWVANDAEGHKAYGPDNTPEAVGTFMAARMKAGDAKGSWARVTP